MLQTASLPWQLADSAKIYKEGNDNELLRALEIFINDKNIRSTYAKKGQNRSHEYFCHEGMTDNFKKIVKQVMLNDIIYHKRNERYVQWKAF